MSSQTTLRDILDEWRNCLLPLYLLGLGGKPQSANGEQVDQAALVKKLREKVIAAGKKFEDWWLTERPGRMPDNLKEALLPLCRMAFQNYIPGQGLARLQAARSLVHELHTDENPITKKAQGTMDLPVWVIDAPPGIRPILEETVRFGGLGYCQDFPDQINTKLQKKDYIAYLNKNVPKATPWRFSGKGGVITVKPR